MNLCIFAFVFAGVKAKHHFWTFGICVCSGCSLRQAALGARSGSGLCGGSTGVGLGTRLRRPRLRILGSLASSG